jgi:hypothetical protein
MGPYQDTHRSRMEEGLTRVRSIDGNSGIVLVLVRSLDTNFLGMQMIVGFKV